MRCLATNNYPVWYSLITSNFRVKYMKKLYLFMFSMLLLGCGGREEQLTTEEVQDNIVQNVVLQENMLYGYWIAQQADERHFEFYSSVVDGELFNNDLKEGRVITDGEPTSLFYWTINGAGTIFMDFVDFNCIDRPLNLCDTIERGEISITGSNHLSASWNVRFLDLQGNLKSQYTIGYEKKMLDLTYLTDGEFFWGKPVAYFTFPLNGRVANGDINVSVGFLDVSVDIATPIPNAEFETIDFDMVSTESVEETQNFFVSGTGFMDFTVTKSLRNMTARASLGEEIAFQYWIVREIIVPDGIDASLIQVGDFVELEKRTVIYDVHTDFIAGPVIQPGERYYSWFVNQWRNEDFEDYFTNFGGTNELYFETETEGYFVYDDMHLDKYSTTRKFTWSQPDNTTVELSFEDGSFTTIKFVEERFGGYSSWYEHTNAEGVVFYYFHDFFFDSFPDVTADFPGRFELDSNSSFGKLYVDFNEDGSMTFVEDIGLDGFWFFDSEREVVSHQCLRFDGRTIEDYQECEDSFDFVESDERYTSFSHVRRFRILHKEGNEYTVKYDANIWGARVAVVDRDYIGISWTYRLRRVGDVEDDE